MNSERLKKFFRTKFPLRTHMFFILSATFFVGLLTTKFLLTAGLNNIPIRYAAAVIAAYLSFFGLIKLWIMYVTHTRGKHSHVHKSTNRTPDPDVANVAFDVFDMTPSGGGGLSSHGTAEEIFRGGGGGYFGGGGASGSFTAKGDVLGNTIPQTDNYISSIGGKEGGFLNGLTPDIDEKAAIILGVLALCIAAIFSAGIYLIYYAPSILSDAAFNFMLSTGLLRSLRRIEQPGWTGSILKSTIIPFLTVFTLALLLGSVIQHYFPDAVKITDAFRN